eukprot:CAMPEP_0180402630 /NCGR_PEP_ID=MMETSP0989-20121125/38967_1 /TAXON_ID=697907 /ORGANISM="non described non described, Strain CCMP2293" /LENGTH=66 /DNA_ID=CAMNT_0022405757 /DNA_START=16 /DNA_END=213 /DNA_ORIENTATION=-
MGGMVGCPRESASLNPAASVPITTIPIAPPTFPVAFAGASFSGNVNVSPTPGPPNEHRPIEKLPSF